MFKSIHHSIFERKHELNAANLTGTQSFPRFGEVVQIHIFWVVKL